MYARVFICITMCSKAHFHPLSKCNLSTLETKLRYFFQKGTPRISYKYFYILYFYIRVKGPVATSIGFYWQSIKIYVHCRFPSFTYYVQIFSLDFWFSFWSEGKCLTAGSSGFWCHKANIFWCVNLKIIHIWTLYGRNSIFYCLHI